MKAFSRRISTARAIAIAGAALFAFCPVTASASGTTITFVGPGTDWNAASNWSPAQVPTASDDAVISGGNPTLSTGADGTAKSITISGGLQLTVSGGRTLAVGAGASGIAGNGISVQGGATVTFAGAVTMTGGSISFSSGGGLVDLLSGAALNLAADGVGALNFGGGLIHISAGAALTRNVAGTSGNLGVPVDNDGQVSVTAGKLTLGEGTGGQTSTGTYTATAPGTLDFLAGDNSLGTTAKITGTGTAEFDSGTTTIPAGSTATPSPYNPATTILNGTLSLGTSGSTQALTAGSNAGKAGTANLDVSGAATIGNVTVSAGHLNLDGATTLNGNGITVTGGAEVALAGATTWTGGAISFSSGGGLVDVLSGATLDIAADGVGALNFGGGLIHISAGATLTRSVAGTGGNLGVPVDNDGTVHAATGTLTIGEGLTQTGGVTTVDAGAALDGAVTLGGGTLKGNGTLGGPIANTGGTVAPGASPGTLTIAGDYAQGAGGTLSEEITGTAPGTQFDRLLVGGNASLDGTLAIQSGAFTPAPTDSFKIIGGAASRTGTFATVTGANIGGNQYVPQYDADGVTLLVNGTLPTNTVPPSIPSTGHPGDLITCNPGTWTGSPTFTYAWTHDGTAISGQTAQTYTLTDADAGHQIRCRVTAHNAGGDSAPADSNALSATITVAAPANTGAPSIPSTGHPGDEITCNPGTWTGSPTFTYAWTRDGSTISGQTSQSYALTNSDVGRQTRCRGTAHNAGGDSTPVDSNALHATALPPVGECSLCIVGASSSVNLRSSGHGSVVASGPILINGAARISGSGKIRGTAIGMYPTAAGSTHFSPQPVALARAVADPLASLSLPSVAERCERVSPGHRSVTLHPGVYCGLRLSGGRQATLAPGLYEFTGDVRLSGRSSLRGTGVDLRLSGASVELSGESRLDLSAPASGHLRDVAVLFDRPSREALTLTGGSRATLDGALYGRAARLSLSGSSVVSCDHGPIVIGSLERSGSTKVLERGPS